jgi:hypothetical protein
MTITHDARHPALVDRMLELVLEALEKVAPPPLEAATEEDIDWEDGEPEDDARPA